MRDMDRRVTPSKWVTSPTPPPPPPCKQAISSKTESSYKWTTSNWRHCQMTIFCSLSPNNRCSLLLSVLSSVTGGQFTAIIFNASQLCNFFFTTPFRIVTKIALKIVVAIASCNTVEAVVTGHFRDAETRKTCSYLDLAAYENVKIQGLYRSWEKRSFVKVAVSGAVCLPECQSRELPLYYFFICRMHQRQH